MSRNLRVQPLTAQAFAPFGDVLEATGAPDKIINAGRCGRYHDRARLDFADGRAGLSLFKSETVRLPYTLTLVERHPEGSQAFVPMSEHPFLVVVASDFDGKPGDPKTFVTQSGQGINFHRGVWHGVLTPLDGPGVFAVVDRVGAGSNLQEHRFSTAYTITEI